MHTRVNEELGLDGDDRLIPLTDTKVVVGISRSKIYQLISSDKFPRPVKVGTRTLFSEKEVRAWVLERLQARTTAAS